MGLRPEREKSERAGGSGRRRETRRLGRKWRLCDDEEMYGSMDRRRSEPNTRLLITPTGKGRKDIRLKVDSSWGQQPPSYNATVITTLRLRFFFAALFAAVVHAAAIGQEN